MWDHEHLFTLLCTANKLNLHINRYNEMCEKISQTEYDLERLRARCSCWLRILSRVESVKHEYDSVERRQHSTAEYDGN
jgi:hypothetical protein